MRVITLLGKQKAPNSRVWDGVPRINTKNYFQKIQLISRIYIYTTSPVIMHNLSGFNAQLCTAYSKYDKDWLDTIWLSFENIESDKKPVKIDWNLRDRVYLGLVKEKCKDIYNRIPYQRVTESAIGTELGIRNMLYNNSDKIPDTISYIQKNHETVE